MGQGNWNRDIRYCVVCSVCKRARLPTIPRVPCTESSREAADATNCTFIWNAHSETARLPLAANRLLYYGFFFSQLFGFSKMPSEFFSSEFSSSAFSSSKFCCFSHVLIFQIDVQSFAPQKCPSSSNLSKAPVVRSTTEVGCNISDILFTQFL